MSYVCQKKIKSDSNFFIHLEAEIIKILILPQINICLYGRLSREI